MVKDLRASGEGVPNARQELDDAIFSSEGGCGLLCNRIVPRSLLVRER